MSPKKERDQDRDREQEETYDYAAFAVLVYEFGADDPRVADRKIRGALKRKQLGAFDEARIGRLRQLKNDLQQELQNPRSSPYFRGPTSTFASPEDFDQVKLTEALARKYAPLDAADLGRMVSLSIYVYYLR